MANAHISMGTQRLKKKIQIHAKAAFYFLPENEEVK